MTGLAWNAPNASAGAWRVSSAFRPPCLGGATGLEGATEPITKKVSNCKKNQELV